MKTQKADTSVAKFIASVADESQRADAKSLIALLTKATKSEPKMWGTSIIGFGSCVLTYPNGRTLGKGKTGKGCIYINKLADVDVKVLMSMAKKSVKAKAK